MKYCADTWFILNLFEKDIKSINILQEIKYGKANLVIPIVVYAEAIKKLLQKGISKEYINQFFSGVESSNKIKFSLIEKTIAIEAAKISLSYNLPLIDSFIAATCKLMDCDALLSGDEHYKSLIKRKYIKVYSW